MLNGLRMSIGFVNNPAQCTPRTCQDQLCCTITKYCFAIVVRPNYRVYHSDSIEHIVGSILPRHVDDRE